MPKSNCKDKYEYLIGYADGSNMSHGSREDGPEGSGGHPVRNLGEVEEDDDGAVAQPSEHTCQASARSLCTLMFKQTCSEVVRALF